ncbi:MAG: hypothetical protein K2Q18_12210 [Bdellovibrionales bacterium]|nr:hypothetical protein [Bdellovibrionales bacterium]
MNNLVPHDALILIARIIGFAIMLQSLEFIKMKESISESGIWRWTELRSDYLFLPKKLLSLLDWVMAPKRFLEMMTIRFYTGLLSFIYPHFIIIFFILLLTTFLITIRWRGSFNGGSDYLTLIISACLFVGFLHPLLTKAALWYITLQVVSSYFLAGLYKIKEPKWRMGTAVFGFVSSPNYKTPKFIMDKSRDEKWAKILAWGVIVFELSFPLALYHPFTGIYLGLGIIFHLMNFITFGLNRFFWVWCASYPAIYFCSKMLIDFSQK